MRPTVLPVPQVRPAIQSQDQQRSGVDSAMTTATPLGEVEGGAMPRSRATPGTSARTFSTGKAAIRLGFRSANCDVHHNLLGRKVLAAIRFHPSGHVRDAVTERSHKLPPDDRGRNNRNYLARCWSPWPSSLTVNRTRQMSPLRSRAYPMKMTPPQAKERQAHLNFVGPGQLSWPDVVRREPAAEARSGAALPGVGQRRGVRASVPCWPQRAGRGGSVVHAAVARVRAR